MSSPQMNELDAKLAKLAHNVYSINLYKVVCECGPLGTFIIEGRKPDEKFAATSIPGVRVMEDEGDQKFKPRDIPGAEIGRDIVERNPGLGLICYAEGDTREPGDDDLATAADVLRAADEQRLLWGDHMWEKSHDRALISGEWTRAVRRLGANREWAADFKVDAQKRCRFCAEYIRAEAIVCKHCGRDVVEAAPQEAGTAALPSKTKR